MGTGFTGILRVPWDSYGNWNGNVDGNRNGMRTGMNVTEIGLVGFSQLHSYFLHFMSPTHRQLLTVFLFLHSNLEQRHQCGMWLRRLVYIFITVRKLSEIYLKTNLSLFSEHGVEK